ncbi:zinc-ribbon domain-containing protein [Candidatus Woesearchaeota archaeon]|nr:zinc-ribbon domain-containing protein [Candidatus Woesearchaeota archaeon]
MPKYDMVCLNCGAELRIEDKFCPRCKTKVKYDYM